jgi:dTDP-4-amino-4,6-dideoxygalactose transaminase
MDPAGLERVITARTKAILPVHLYGQPADMKPILEIARRSGLIVIEDAAQAHGAEYADKRVGGIGDIGCFSFYPGKNLGAYGEGGMIVTGNPEFARTVRMLRDWGQAGRYCHELRGYNYRMDAIQGAILRVKLRRLDRWNEIRRAHAVQYGRLLAGAGITPPAEMNYARHVYAVYTIRSARRDDLQRHLAGHNIQTAIHYPAPVYRQNAYLDAACTAEQFPAAERACREVLSLPVHPELSPQDIETVAAQVSAFESAGAIR